MSKHTTLANLSMAEETEKSWSSVLKLWLSLTKPRIVISIALTALIGFVLHPQFLSTPFWVSIVLVLAVALATAGGAVMNHYLERDTDKLMQRTKNRPLPSARINTPRHSLWFGLGLTGLGLVLCYTFLGIWSTFYLACGAFSYVVLYTAWLKHRSIWSVPVGGIAGAFAVWVGSSVGGADLTFDAWFFALALHFWSPAHFWNFAAYQRDDYRKAGIPQLPEKIGIVRSNIWIAIHTVAVIACSMALAIWGTAGWLYGTLALASGLIFLYFNIKNIFNPSDALSRKNFIYSLIYLTMLFVAILADFYFRLFFT